MRHGSLFSGIGGFDLAAEWMGWENVFHCEWNNFGQRILKYYWPNAISYHDITKTNFTIHRGSIDILTGGFPCQPYSTAGKRLGKADERHLWPEMLRAIKEISPRYVVGENVRGLTNWNGGLVFDEVCADLENIGYQVAPFLIPACGTNAPHKRERVWFVAHRNGTRFQEARAEQQTAGIEQHGELDGYATDTDGNGRDRGDREHEEQSGTGWKYAQRHLGASNDDGTATDPDEQRLERKRRPIGKLERQFRPVGTNTRNMQCGTWQNFPTVSPLCHGNDGLPAKLDGITFSKWRNESIKGGGNAIVPQVVLQIFKAIEAYEK